MKKYPQNYNVKIYEVFPKLSLDTYEYLVLVRDINNQIIWYSVSYNGFIEKILNLFKNINTILLNNDENMHSLVQFL